jgi:hypothetical protein
VAASGFDRLQVVLWKWRDRRKRHIIFDYSPEAVNRKASELRRHLAIPHDIVCITDDGAGLSSEIRVVPLWPEGRELDGCWCRLKAFAPEMREVIGPRFAWIDLDSIVVGPLDPLFRRAEPAIFYRSDSVPGTPYNGSLVMMDAGARAQVWTSFDPARSPALSLAAGFKGTDQSWIAYVLGKEETVWTRADGVLHFTLDCVPDLPADGRIVFFPGVHKPHMAMAREHAPWIARYVP